MRIAVGTSARWPGDESPGYTTKGALWALRLKPRDLPASAGKPEGRRLKCSPGIHPRVLRASLLVLILATPLLLQGCASERYSRPSTGEVQRGVASWYGPDFHGKPTASGETYDMHQLTAAHRDLPLHTRIEVLNLDNGRTVEVVVNDRGPYVRGRVLDLSYAAAKKLDMVGPGLARVEIRVLEVGHGRPGPTRFTRYTVQVGAFRDAQNARAVEAKLKAAGFAEIELQSEGDWHRVRLGLFVKRSEADALARRLATKGFVGIVVPLS